MDEDGVPFITLVIAGQSWRAVLDSGFNGDLELPDALRAFLNPQFIGLEESILWKSTSLLERLFSKGLPDRKMVLRRGAFLDARATKRKFSSSALASLAESCKKHERSVGKAF